MLRNGLMREARGYSLPDARWVADRVRRRATAFKRREGLSELPICYPPRVFRGCAWRRCAEVLQAEGLNWWPRFVPDGTGSPIGCGRRNGFRPRRRRPTGRNRPTGNTIVNLTTSNQTRVLGRPSSPVFEPNRSSTSVDGCVTNSTRRNSLLRVVARLPETYRGLVSRSQ